MDKKDDDIPIIGKHISWEELHTHCKSGLFKVEHFTEFATVKNGKVKSISPVMPYGVLTVECMEIGSQFSLWVTHKIDFYNLWEAHRYRTNLKEYQKLLQERIRRFEDMAGDQLDQLGEIYNWLRNARHPEILVGDFARQRLMMRKRFAKLFGSFMPSLYVWICPEGYLQRSVSDNLAPLSGEMYFEIIRPLAKWEPGI